MNGHRATKGILVAVAAVFVMALVIPSIASTAQAAPVPNGSGSGSQQWAYGGERWVNTSVVLPNLTYSLHAFFGFSAIYTLTNTSATTFELEAQRTAAASLYADMCVPNCAAPVDHANLSAKAWESDTGFANFTTQATVYENGTATPAFGILNASAQSAANLTESFLVSGSVHGAARSASASLNVQGTARASIDFAPSLGLVPWNAAPNATWNSSSAFSAQGAWSASWSAVRTFGNNTVSASGHPSASVSGNGTLSLWGADLGVVSLQNGQTVPVIVLAISGPFDDVDGMILIPHDFDMFGDATHPWDGESYGFAHLVTSKVDLWVDAVHHRVRFDAAAANANGASSGLSASPGATMGATGMASGPAPASAELQAQPEAVSQAQQQSACFTGSCGGSSAASSAGLLVLIVGSLVALVVGTVGVVEYRAWSKRRAAQGLPASTPQVPASGLPPAGALQSPPNQPPAPSSVAAPVGQEPPRTS